MDGQLGINGEDFDGEKHINGAYSIVPCLINKFLAWRSPDSSTDTSETEGKPSLKVLYILPLTHSKTNKPRLVSLTHLYVFDYIRYALSKRGE